jgi:Flp pilus assembly protein TadB
MNTDLSQRHDTLTTAVLAVLVGLTGLAALLDAVLTATGHPVLVGLGAAILAGLVGVARWLARRVRERREDAADLLAGAAWRAAQHTNDTERDQSRAGVA